MSDVERVAEAIAEEVAGWPRQWAGNPNLTIELSPDAAPRLAEVAIAAGLQLTPEQARRILHITGWRTEGSIAGRIRGYRYWEPSDEQLVIYLRGIAERGGTDV